MWRGKVAKIIIKAYAKINLTLDVLGKRADGYHQVETVMQGINLYDLVEMERTGREIRLVCNIPELEGKDNLAFRAAVLMKEKYGLKPGFSINLQKNIPVEAGLGGGSADAAAVILGVNQLCGLDLTLEEMRADAAGLGSDVPFCLRPLTALATGRGEQIKDLETCPVLWLALAKPPFGVSAAEAYRHLSRVSIKKRPALQAVLQAIAGQQKGMLYQHMDNVLEEATFDLYPRLKTYVREIEALGARKVMMSGSGPTLLVFGENEEEARRLANLLKKPDWQVFVSRTTVAEDLVTRIMLSDNANMAVLSEGRSW